MLLLVFMCSKKVALSNNWCQIGSVGGATSPPHIGSGCSSITVYIGNSENSSVPYFSNKKNIKVTVESFHVFTCDDYILCIEVWKVVPPCKCIYFFAVLLNFSYKNTAIQNQIRSIKYKPKFCIICCSRVFVYNYCMGLCCRCKRCCVYNVERYFTETVYFLYSSSKSIVCSGTLFGSVFTYRLH